MNTPQWKIAFTSVWDGLTKRGLFSTAAMIVAVIQDWMLSKKRGLEDFRYFDPKDSKNLTSSSVHGNYFQPVRVFPFLEVIRLLKVNTNSNFVDIGAGTGKAMYLAAELGFKTVRGCEICSELVAVAEKNLEKAKSERPNLVVDLRCMDAMEFSFSSNDEVIFMNDPFYEPLFSKFLQKVEAFQKEKNQPIVLIYKNNSSRKVDLVDQGQIKAPEVIEILGNRFEVYRFRND